MHLASQDSFKPVAMYPKLSNPRYNSLDFWRGAACLGIVVLHAAFFAKVGLDDAEMHKHHLAAIVYNLIGRLWVGVPMFFVISGYCIAATADSSRRKSHPTANYFKRRLKRIFPPYWVVLILAVSLGAIAAIAGKPTFLSETSVPHVPAIPALSEMSPAQWIGTFTLTEKWREHIAGPPFNALVAPAWTLCYEEQFYAVCGILLLVAHRRIFSGAVVVTGFTILTTWLWITHPSVHITGFFFDGGWLMFAAGVFVYYHLNYQQPGLRKFVVPGGLLLSILVLHEIPHRFPRFMTPESIDALYSLFVANIFAIILLVLRPLDGFVTNSKILSPVSMCGRMCYSLYLIHWLVAVVLGHMLLQAGIHGLVPVLTITLPILFVVSIAAAWAFYMLVERHFLNTANLTAADLAPVKDAAPVAPVPA